MNKKLKIILGVIIFGLFVNISFAGNQNYINIYEAKIKRNEKEIKELSDYIMKYGIVKDIKYYEKLLEKYEYMQEKEENKKKGLEYFRKCIEKNEICTFLGKKSEENSISEVDKFINKTEDLRKEYEIKAEKLNKTVDYLNKSKLEIEQREKAEEIKNKIKDKESNYIKKDKKEKVKKKSETKKILLKETILKKLNEITKDYSEVKKGKIYKKILERLKLYKKNEKVSTLIEVLEEKVKNKSL